MPQGSTWPSEIQEYRDEITGARVRRLTASDTHDHHLYFTSTSYTARGDIVFGSQRTGSPQLFLMEMPAGRIVQLTDEPGVSPLTACVHPTESLAYYICGRALKQVSIDDYSTHVLYEAPEGFRLTLPSITGDGSRIAIAYSERIAVSTETGRIYATMAETYYRHPHSAVVTVDTADGAAQVIWGEANWISHVCLSPVDRNCVVLCHEGGSWVKQRMWVVDAEKQYQQARPLLKQDLGEVCYHEYFTCDGQVGVQCNLQRDGGSESYHCFLRPDGTWLRQYLLPGPPSGHIQSNSDNSLRIGDRAFRFADDAEGAQMMGLYRFDGGRDVPTWLCRHGGDFSLQVGHPHPIFSPDDQWVLFTSSAGGLCNVYTAEVGSIDLPA